MKVLIRIFTIALFLNAPSALANKEDPLLASFYQYMQTTKRFNECPFEDRYGANYRRNDKKTNHLKFLVESVHFTKGVQKLEYGNTGGLEFDLDYVLRKFPNHAHALMLMADLQLMPKFEPRRRLDRADKLWPTKECYFFKAMQLQPHDPSVHLVIAIFYHKLKKYKIAARHYAYAKQLNPRNAEIQYNQGLFFMDINEHQKALENAKLAMQLGHPLQGLKNRLVRAGAWQ